MSRSRRRRGPKQEADTSRTQRAGWGRIILTRWTGVYGGAGVLAVVGGFFLLSQGSINLAPILLALGFLIFFPLALVK